MATARPDRADTATARSNVYGFLAAVFRAEPSADLLAQIARPAFAETLAALNHDSERQPVDIASGDLLEDLAVEFTRLFIGPGPRISPHESVNLEIRNPLEATLWGPQTVKVKKFIEATGLDYDPAFTEMPDHISAELEFMQRLTAKESEAWGEGNEELANGILAIQKRFFDEHLSAWVPRFCDKVMAAAELDFYRTMARLTKQVIVYEQDSFDAAQAAGGTSA